MARFDKICTYSWSRLRVARPRNNPGKKMPKKLSSNLWLSPAIRFEAKWSLTSCWSCRTCKLWDCVAWQVPIQILLGSSCGDHNTSSHPYTYETSQDRTMKQLQSKCDTLKKKKSDTLHVLQYMTAFVATFRASSWQIGELRTLAGILHQSTSHNTAPFRDEFDLGDLGPRQLLFSINAVNGDVMPISNSPSITNLQWHRRQGGRLLWANGWEPIAAIDGHSVTGAQELALGVPFTAAYQ